MKQSLRAAAAGLVVVPLLAGCGSTSDASDGPSSDQRAVPTGLLSEDQVGGTAIGDALEELNGVASPCGPDNSNLISGSTKANTMAYRVGTGDTQDVVVIGSWDREPSVVESGMDELRSDLDPGKCQVSYPVEVRSLDSASPSSASFGVVVEDGEGERTSTVRSYTYLEDAQKLVMVSIKRTGEGDPSTSMLEKLTEEQVDKTTSAAS